MKARGFFLARTEARRIEAFPDGLAPEIPDSGEEGMDQDEGTVHAGDDDLGYAEGQTFIMEYESAKGDISTRRVTVWGISSNQDGIPVLTARCHERNATRSFRMDRIREIYDFDGCCCEPLDQFLVENFGMSPRLAQLATREELGDFDSHVASTQNTLALARAICRANAVQLLWCLANSDHEFHPEEFERIVLYVDSCLADASCSLSEQDFASLTNYVKRLRPTWKTVESGLAVVAGMTDAQKRRFANACISIITADGVEHANEVSALEAIMSETGLSL